MFPEEHKVSFQLQVILKRHGLLENGHFKVSVMAAFGYRVRDPRPKTRQPLEQIVKWVK